MWEYWRIGFNFVNDQVLPLSARKGWTLIYAVRPRGSKLKNTVGSESSDVVLDQSSLQWLKYWCRHNSATFPEMNISHQQCHDVPLTLALHHRPTCPPLSCSFWTTSDVNRKRKMGSAGSSSTRSRLSSVTPHNGRLFRVVDSYYTDTYSNPPHWFLRGLERVSLAGPTAQWNWIWAGTIK